ncbi:MAG: GT-D fold domain-containing protein, partial [Lachnospiraceae bacterium]|nr:GT-D fold domain-containing protein [Lachnospiraceae bacterium]
VYYDAYLFKCYFQSKDRDDATRRYALVKRIWQDRDVLLIEGAETRTGQGNDLLDGARSIQRILCPTQNAYTRYQDILDKAEEVAENKLILCALGPAGKVLAYDLIQNGHQVVDIGQIDMEYEWYRAGVGIKVPNPTKYVSQLPPALVEEIHDEKYQSQIIAVID